MGTMRNIRCLSVGFCLAATIPIVGFGETRDSIESVEAIGGPLTGSPVLDAPFSADAITTVKLTLLDGTRLDQRTTARYYRDRAGRARVELKMEGLGAPATVAARHIRTIVAPDGKNVFTLDPVTRTTRYLPREWLAYAAGGESAAESIGSRSEGGLTFAVPIPGDGGRHPARFLVVRRAQDLLASKTTVVTDVRDEGLGNRRIEDVETTGRRVTMTIPIGELRNDKPFEMVDERWESPELKVLISARITDSRMGDVEYRLTNIRRGELPADLFVVPEDYTIDTRPLLIRETGYEAYISLFYADRYPTVGQALGNTLGPR